jgi:hypothetical protein
MKNLYLIPTDKPSRLIIYSTLLNEFRLLNDPIEDWKHKRHIYITSDEEIKEGDWCIYHSGEVIQYLVKLNTDNLKKIILTTDQDLIKDGVQAIDDEFLEWFVKNPSCESVEVKELLSNNGNAFYGYKIIIPTEKPKQVDEKGKPLTYWGGLEELKKETLKEAAEQFKILGNILEDNYDLNVQFHKLKRECIFSFAVAHYDEKLTFKEWKKTYYGNYIDQPKWQAERMYSEEDMKLAFETGRNFQLTGENNFNELIEQFKKK